MARRRIAEKRAILPDPIYGDTMVTILIRKVMHSGKKPAAERIVYGALKLAYGKYSKKKRPAKDDIVRDDGGFIAKHLETPAELLKDAIGRIRPTLEVRPRRVGGATYQVPVEVSQQRGLALAMRWLVEGAKERSDQWEDEGSSAGRSGQQGSARRVHGSMAVRLAGELLDAIEEKGSAIKQRDNAIRMAKANQAFAHFAWKG